jgi:hypothetical protein
MLESESRNADRFPGELIATCSTIRHAEYESALNNLQIAREVGARIEVLEGHDYVGTLIRLQGNTE